MCSICWRVDNMHSCTLCGRTVCMNCFDAQSGLCRACRGGRRMEPGQGQNLSKGPTPEEFNSLL